MSDFDTVVTVVAELVNTHGICVTVNTHGVCVTFKTHGICVTLTFWAPGFPPGGPGGPGFPYVAFFAAFLPAAIVGSSRETSSDWSGLSFF